MWHGWREREREEKGTIGALGKLSTDRPLSRLSSGSARSFGFYRPDLLRFASPRPADRVFPRFSPAFHPRSGAGRGGRLPAVRCRADNAQQWAWGPCRLRAAATPTAHRCLPFFNLVWARPRSRQQAAPAYPPHRDSASYACGWDRCGRAIGTRAKTVWTT